MTPDLAIPEAVRRIADGFRPERIILFGSRARGDARPQSDIDLLVLVDDQFDLSAGTSGMYLAMRGVGWPVDIVVMRLAEFERFKDYIGTVARPAAREGKVFYQRVA